MVAVRVLVVDDSALVRKLVSDALGESGEIEVVGVAPNGRLALQKLAQCSPDVVTLDVEMPEMDGLATLAELRKTHGKLPVIMLSSHTERGGKITLDALALGASDYVTKPSQQSGGSEQAKATLGKELIPKILALCRKSTEAGAVSTPRVPRTAPPTVSSQLGTTNPKAIIIAVSTGGPNALAAFIPQLPADLPVPVLMVQHMPPMFTKLLAERLDNSSNVRVHEGVAGMLVEPGRVYIAPGDYHMVVQRRTDGKMVLALNQDPQENSCRPAADVLFRSAVECYGGDLLAVVMTGMGADGKRGCELVRERGGQVVAQDEDTSVVWGMPGAVVEAGLAHAVRPLNLLAQEVVTRLKPGR